MAPASKRFSQEDLSPFRVIPYFSRKPDLLVHFWHSQSLDIGSRISRHDLFKLMLLHSALLGRLSPLPITKRAFFFLDADMFCPISETGS